MFGDLRLAIAHGRDREKNLTLEEVEQSQMFMKLGATLSTFFDLKGSMARLGLKRKAFQFRGKKLGIARPGPEPWHHEIASAAGRVGHPEILAGELP